MTPEQRAILRAAHPDLGGSHDAFVRAMKKLRAASPEPTSNLEREVLDRLMERSPLLVSELVADFGLSPKRDYIIRNALSRLSRRRLAHASKIRIRIPERDGKFCPSLLKQTHALAWFAGPAPALLTAQVS